GGAVPGQDDAGDPGALGAAEHRPEVARVGDPGDDQQERGGPVGTGVAEVVQRDRVERPGPGQHPLGGVGSGFGVETPAGHHLHPDVPAGGQSLDPVELGGRVLPVGDPQLADRAAAGGQELQDGLAALHLVAAQLPRRTPPAGVVDGCRCPGGPPPSPPADGRAGGPSVTGPGTGGPAAGRLGPTTAANGPTGTSPTSPGPISPGPTSPGPAGTPPTPGGTRPAPGRHGEAVGRSSTKATARQPMPSARPNAPRPSARVALTDTGAPTAAASRSAMRPVYGARRGASATTVQSTLT